MFCEDFKFSYNNINYDLKQTAQYKNEYLVRLFKIILVGMF